MQADAMTRMRRFFGRGTQDKEVAPLSERRTYLRTAIHIALPATLLFSVINYVEGQALLATIEFFDALVLLSLSHHLSKSDQTVGLAENLSILYGLIITVALAVIGGVEGSGPLWIIAFPFFAFLIKGQAGGWISCVIWWFTLACAFALSQDADFAYQYHPDYRLQIIYMVVFYTLLAAAFNVVRTDFEIKLDKLVKENTRKAQLYLDKLQFWALHDRASRLPNRNYLREHVVSDLKGPESAGGYHYLVAAIKVQRYLDVACILGSDGGRTLSRAIAKVLNDRFGEFACVANNRPDEFFVAYWGTPEETDPQAIQRRFADLLLELQFGNLNTSLECSVGIAYTPGHATDADDLLIRAEDALRQAERSGKQLALFDETERQAIIRSHDIYNRLNEAIEDKKLSLFYQPKIDLQANRIVGVEALARWIDETEGFISPDEFIPIAENSGMIKPLTAWIIDEGFRQVKEWHDCGMDVKVSLNLSVKNLLDPEIGTVIGSALKRHAVEPKWIILEITETSFADSSETLFRVIDELTSLGFILSMDDFGTGYSSFSYLKDLNVGELKIDQVFVRDIDTDRKSQDIVKTITQIARGFGLQVVAEGVETATHAEMLAAYGVHIAQGYHYSRPLPAPEFKQFYQSYS